jgi:hypothetical protein
LENWGTLIILIIVGSRSQQPFQEEREDRENERERERERKEGMVGAKAAAGMRAPDIMM